MLWLASVFCVISTRILNRQPVFGHQSSKVSRCGFKGKHHRFFFFFNTLKCVLQILGSVTPYVKIVVQSLFVAAEEAG